MKHSCAWCKGRYPEICGKEFCPILAKIQSQRKVNLKAKQDFFGASPNVFVGRYGYPDINVGILSNEEVTEEYDNPMLWSAKNYSINQVIDFRTSLINSNFKTNIKTFNDKLLDISKEVSMASKPVDVEVHLNKKPEFKLSFTQEVTPHGPSVKVEKARITENPKVPVLVDKTVSDTDLKANEAVNSLFKKGFDEHYLTKLLSVGNLGIGKNRKLVPTRWSITAVDDTLAKNMVEEIKQYNEADYTAFFGGLMGNYYLALFFPEVWSYELFEMYMPKSLWNVEKEVEAMTDYEPYTGRKTYAQNCAGGYYAARLAVLEKLKSMKRQASVLLLRFISDEYWAPLGVWVVREAVRNTMRSKPINFASKELMLKYAEKLVKKKYNYDIDKILKQSILLKRLASQSKLWQFSETKPF